MRTRLYTFATAVKRLVNEPAERNCEGLMYRKKWNSDPAMKYVAIVVLKEYLHLSVDGNVGVSYTPSIEDLTAKDWIVEF